MPRKAPVEGSLPREALNRFRRWFGEAKRSGQALPEAVALATADARGRPSVRFVLLKQADEQGFVFYTNAHSRKGREIHQNPRAALALTWDRLRRQVRVEGRIKIVSDGEADAYWETRPRASQLAALASAQSQPLSSRVELVERWKNLRSRYRDLPVPRPPGWTGFRLIPDEIEFWVHRDHRLHDREVFVRVRRAWRRRLLQP